MKNTIRLFITLGCLVSITMCNGQNSKFKAFIEKFEQLTFPFEVGSNPIQGAKVPFSKGFKRSEFLSFLNDIKEYTSKEMYFHYGGKAKYKEFNVLIYRITNFGDAPALDTIKVELVTFDSKWKMLSKMVIGGQETDDKLINCLLKQDMTFVVSILNSSNRLIRKEKYFIDDDGKIKIM